MGAWRDIQQHLHSDTEFRARRRSPSVGVENWNRFVSRYFRTSNLRYSRRDRFVVVWLLHRISYPCTIFRIFDRWRRTCAPRGGRVSLTYSTLSGVKFQKYVFEEIIWKPFHEEKYRSWMSRVGGNVAIASSKLRKTCTTAVGFAFIGLVNFGYWSRQIVQPLDKIG